MDNKRLIFRVKEGVKPAEVLPSQPMSESVFEVGRLYDIEEEVASFRLVSPMAEGVDDNETLFETQIYDTKTDPEKKIFRTYYVSGEDEAADSLFKELQENENVEYVQYDELNELYYTPNDPRLAELWGITKIACPAAWDTSFGEDIVVAVIDTGVDYNHPDIKDSMWKNANDKYGYDFSDNDDDPKDYHGHGTHCAGTIAATINNAVGVVGVAPKSKIMALKIFPNAQDSVCANAIKYAADNGARVLSNSWGPTSRRPSNPAVDDMIDYAYGKGCIVVFAAGNADDDVQYYSPANYSKVISVGATDPNDQRATFSNYGDKITIGAPGVGILSLEMDTSGYNLKSGTSMACPHVAGLAALLLKVNRQLTFEKVKFLIVTNADPIQTDKPISGRRINANRAVIAAVVPPKVIGVRMTFNLTDDDKDKEEEIQLTVRKNGSQIGYGGFGNGVKWNDPGSYPCTVNTQPFPLNELGQVKIRMYKTPYGSATGNGMEGTIDCDIICEGNLVQRWFSIPERRYGDNNPFDVLFP